MGRLDREILSNRSMIVNRHLDRVQRRLPTKVADFLPASDLSDAVILHLWQAVQLTIDTAISLCVNLKLGTPATYAEAFLTLAKAGFLEQDLAVRLSHSAGFRNRLVHAYEDLDMQKIYKIAQEGPADLKAFFKAAIQCFKK